MSRWRSPSPTGAADLMRDVRTTWWIAGGWAIELFVGRFVREHSDLEVGCFRSDVEKVVAQLPGWDVRVARDDRLDPFTALSLAERSIHSIWCRPLGSEYWSIEILVEDRDGADWVYRRDTRIRRPLTELAARSPSGLPYLRPEVQLLYKSKAPRPKDDADFNVVWPLLNADAKVWLAEAVRCSSPSCTWEMYR